MVECKEECSVSNEKDVLARISFQRFFRRYLHLAGMSGTAREVRVNCFALMRWKW